MHNGAGATNVPAHRPDRGLLGVFGDTVRTRGLFGLYSGLSPWLLFSFPRAAFRFSVYEHVLSLYDAHFAGQVPMPLRPPRIPPTANIPVRYAILVHTSVRCISS